MSRLKRSADLDYYSFNRVDSYNAVYNFIVGARGLGKTYGAKRKVIKRAINTFKRDGRDGLEQFIYLRRYDTEMHSFNSFFADISHEFPDWDFRINGREAQMASAKSRDEKKRSWITIGYAIALSKAQQFKSVAFPNVTTIIFDEFIIETGHIQYIKNEAKVFNDLYSTVDRWKDKTRVYFLANALSITNPYFLEYDILPSRDGSDEVIARGHGFLVAHFPDSSKFRKGVSETRFGQFINGTTYEAYAVGNFFSDNNDSLIDTKTPNAFYAYTLDTSKGTFSVWIDFAEKKVWLQEKRPKKEVVYVIEPDRMDDGKVLLENNNRFLQYLRTRFRQGGVFFDSPRARNAFITIFRK